ncbi:MAG: helix-turn-helix domain-containing protein [Pseudonocardiaceae bacterium]
MSTPLAQAIQTARRARGLTQPEVAEAAGVSQEAISRYENGVRTPDADVLDRLAAALGVTPELLESAGRMRGAMAVDAPHAPPQNGEADDLASARSHAEHVFGCIRGIYSRR